MQTLHALARAADVSEFELYHCAFRSYLYYRKITESDGVRISPEPKMAAIQKCVAEYLLSLSSQRSQLEAGVYTLSEPVRSAGKNFEFNVLLQNLFVSITAKSVRALLVELGVSQQFAGFLTRLCTYCGCLPDRAPTSSVLINLICAKLDRRLSDFATAHNWTYERKNCLITISGKGKFPAGCDVMDIITDEGFAICADNVMAEQKMPSASVDK